MAKEEKGKTGEDGKAVAVGPAEPKIPFAEFAQSGGVDQVLLAGFRASWQARGEADHRTQAEWRTAYEQFASLPA
jgi:hypothetical protein